MQKIYTRGGAGAGSGTMLYMIIIIMTRCDLAKTSKSLFIHTSFRINKVIGNWNYILSKYILSVTCDHNQVIHTIMEYEKHGLMQFGSVQEPDSHYRLRI